MERTVFGWNPTGFKFCYPVLPYNRWEQYSYPRWLHTAGEKHWKPGRPMPFLRVAEKTCKAQFSDNIFHGGTKTALESVEKRSAQDLKIPMLNNKKMLTSTTGWHPQVDLCHVICSLQHFKVLQQRLEKTTVTFLCLSWTEKRTSGAHQNYRMTLLLHVVWLNLMRHYSKTV